MINIIIFIVIMNSTFRVLFVIFVKRGYVMVENALQLMPVFVPYKMQIVQNVNVEHGIMVVVYSCALIVQHIFVKMINLSTKLHVKFWIQKIINVMYSTKILNSSLSRNDTSMNCFKLVSMTQDTAIKSKISNSLEI